MQSRPTIPARSLFVLFLAASPLTSRAQTPADSGARLLEAGDRALEESTGDGLRRALALGRKAALWFHTARSAGGEARAHLQIGTAHLRLGASDSALAELTQASQLAQGDTGGTTPIEIANALGKAYEQTGDYQRTLEHYRNAYELSRTRKVPLAAVQSLNNMGEAHYYLGHVDSARLAFSQAYDSARALRDTALMGKSVGNLGAVLEEVGLRDSAVRLYRKSLALSRHANDVKNMVSMVSNLGLALHNQGDLDSARVYYKQALRIIEESRLEAPVEKRITENNLGALERAAGRPAAALEYYRKAMASAKSTGDRTAVPALMSNIGVVYLALERYDSAEANFRTAIDTFRVVDAPWPLRSTLHNLGTVYDAMGKHDSAEVYYAAAVKLAGELKDSAAQALGLAGLALIYQSRGQVDSGLTYARRGYALSLRMGVQDVSGDLINIGALHEEAGRLDSARVYYRRAIRVARKMKTPGTLRTALENIGLLYHRGPRPNLLRAVAYYDSAAAVISGFRGETGSDVNRLSFSEGTREMFGVWAVAWLDRAGIRPRASALASLAAADRGRAQGLLNLIGGIREGARPGGSLVREGAALIDGLGAPVLSYYVTNDTLLIWLVTDSGRVHVARQAIARDTLAALVTRLAKSVRAQRPDYLDPARALAEVILPGEIAGHLPERGEIVVVPHGPLALVPFVILTPTGDTAPLGAGRSIRYAPSLAILRRVASRPDRRAAVGRDSSLVVGNPVMPTFVDPAGIEIDLSPLPHTRLEAESVAARVGTEALIGPRATEAEVARRMPGAVVIHLATHGYAYSSDARTRESFVALTPGQEGETEYDGHLTVGEVLDEQTPMTAELVVLSACQTGLGNLKQAEGTIGLQRAFLAKGARSVLVSLWSVPDEATSRLMQRFYSYWLGHDKLSKAEALRRAQADARKDHPHPWYWAAFQLVGAP